MRTIPADKANHIVLCAMAALAGLLIGGLPWLLGLGVAAGVGRELYNVWREGDFSWADIGADAVGIALVLAAAWRGV